MALRDLMNNYLYGKQGRRDFTLADLPQNRRQLFAAVLKVRWGQMVGLNLLYAVAWLPAALWSAISLSGLLGLSGADAGERAGAVATWLLALAPLVAVTGPFNAGATYVLRNWARDEHSFLWSDFWDAVKGNWRQSLAVSCVSGAMPLVVYVAVRFYGMQLERSAIFVLPIALVLLAALLWALAEMLMMPMLVTYELKLRDVVRNAVLLTIGKLPWALLFRLATLAVPFFALAAVRLAPGALGHVLAALSLLYAAFVPVFNKLVTVSYANWLCETYLNPRIPGARTNIGLRPEDRDGEG